jgi:hypothetical protein
MDNEFLDKFLWRSGSELLVEVDHEKMFDAQVADQSDFVLRGSEQVRRVLRTQHFEWMRIKSHCYRRPLCRTGMIRRSGNYGLVTKMNAIKNSDGEKERAMQLSQLGNGVQRFHQWNDE